MAYSAQIDLVRAAGGTQNLIDLSDIEDTGELDVAVLTEAIVAADGLIDSYLARRIAVPLEVVPSRIRSVSAREAVYQLKLGRGVVTEADDKLHERRLEWLDAVAEGRVTIGVDPEPTASTNQNPSVVVVRDEAEDVSRDALKGAW